MSSLLVPNHDIAVKALQHVAQYDAMRLEIYRQKEKLADRIHMAQLGTSMALRFADVGYFNRVYSADENVFENLPEIEEFYRGSSFGFELVGPPSDRSSDNRKISRPGWAPATRYAWMFAFNCRSLAPAEQTRFTIRTPKPSQRLEFLLAYLRAFEAQEDRFLAAIRNMRHLFEQPDLEFLMAWCGEKPAGIGMMMRCGAAALLCAGATLPEFREMGCHSELLAARIQLASESGCEHLYSWATLGGQSQANLQRAGLSLVGTTSAWRFSPGYKSLEPGL